MSDGSFLTCATCLANICGDPLPVNGDGCLVVPATSVIDNGDGTATWVKVEGDGTTFSTVDLLTAGGSVATPQQVLRGDGWSDENTASIWWQSNAATVVDATGSISGAANTTPRVNVASLPFTNNDTSDRVYVAAGVVVNSTQFSGLGSDQFGRLDLGVGIEARVNGVTTPGGSGGYQGSGFQRSGFGHATRHQVSTIARVPPGATVEFTFWGSLMWNPVRPTGWSLNAVNSYVYSINRTEEP